MLPKWATAALSILTGVLLELGIHALSGRQEAWDSAQYWTIGIPGALVASAAIRLCVATAELAVDDPHRPEPGNHDDAAER